MNDITFDYWISDETYCAWYNPVNQSKWCVNQGYIQFLKTSDKVLEVGCNAGFTTCLLSRIVGKNGLVVALDVIPANALIAAAQIGLNAITNVRILHLGAADFNGRIRVNNVNNGSVATVRSEEAIEVDVKRCDDLITEYGFFDVIKVDVEGFESQVFKGAQQLMSKRPRLLLEVHGAEVEKYGSTYDELFRLIRIEQYEGLMYLEPNNPSAPNRLEEFSADRLLRDRCHANLFLSPKPS